MDVGVVREEKVEEEVEVGTEKAQSLRCLH